MLSLSQSTFLSFVSFILSSVCTYIPSAYWYNVPFSQYSHKILQVFSGWHRKQWNTQPVENLFIIFPFGNPLINSLGNIWDAVYKIQVCGFTGKSWSICIVFFITTYFNIWNAACWIQLYYRKDLRFLGLLRPVESWRGR